MSRRASPPGGGGLRARLTRAARLGAVSARTSAGWLAGAVIQGFGRSAAAESLRRAAAARAAEGLGRLKGLAMKLGQVLSFAIDDVPAELRQALETLQTSSPPRPFPEIAPVIERALGRPLRDAFAQVDPVPIAAASIGQVHRGRLPDGTAVAVKVQYYMVLSRLGATAPWRRIAREYVCGDPPATPLGAAERAWLARANRAG